MTLRTKLAPAVLVGHAVLALMGGVTRPARAQPSPFTDYEHMKRGSPPPPIAARPPESPVLPWQRGAWMLGLRSAFSYTGASAASVVGDNESSTTFFFRFTPTLQVHVVDRIALGVSFGLLSRSSGREGGGGSGEIDWLTEVTAHYTFPITARFALTPGLGLGFYFGGSDRRLQLKEGGPPVDESLSTRGFAAALHLDVGYQVTKNFQLRSGLGLFASAGSESVEALGAALGTTAFNFTVPVEVHYTF
ncbi:MAG TPA: hypothetical protein PLR99_17080 [Polyangiaceae bacterium]|nr:hypothetical protein [Polyangiaceae bacterium]